MSNPDLHALCTELLAHLELTRCMHVMTPAEHEEENQLIARATTILAAKPADDLAGLWCIACDSDSSIIRLPADKTEASQ